jgi:hypothetical protein
VLTSYIDLISSLIIQGRTRCLQILGFNPQLIILPLTNKQFKNLLPINDNLSNSISNYYGYVGNHYLAGKLWDFLKRPPFIVNTVVKLNPISHASVYYIDGSSSGKEGIRGPDLHKTIQAFFCTTGRISSSDLFIAKNYR